MPTRRGLTLFERIIALSATRPIFRAAGHITLGGTGNVLSIHDDNDDTHVLTQADTAKQCAPPAPHADFANQLCLTFAALEWYESNRPPSYWVPWHNTGAASLVVCTPTSLSTSRYVCGTFAGTSPGFGLSLSSADHTVLVRTPPGGTNAVVANAGVVPVVGTPTMLQFSYTEGASPEWRIKATGGAAVTGNSAAAPSAAAAENTMRFGSRGAELGLMHGRIACLVTGPDTPEFRSTSAQWATQYTGVAA